VSNGSMPQAPRLPLLFNAGAGTLPKDPDTLLQPLPKELRDRLEPMAFGPPWDFEPHTRGSKGWRPPFRLGWRWHGPPCRPGSDRQRLSSSPGSHSRRQRQRSGPRPAYAAGTNGCLQRRLEGRELRMDLPRLDGEPFLNVCGTGFEPPSRTVSQPCTIAASAPMPRPAGNCGAPGGRESGLGGGTSAHDRRPGAAGTHPGRLSRTAVRPSGQGLEPLFRQPAPVRVRPLDRTGADPTDGALQWATLARPSWFGLLFEAYLLFARADTPLSAGKAACARPACAWNAPCPWHLDGEPAPNGTAQNSASSPEPSACRSRGLAPGPRRSLAQNRPLRGRF